MVSIYQSRIKSGSVPFIDRQDSHAFSNKLWTSHKIIFHLNSSLVLNQNFSAYMAASNQAKAKKSKGKENKAKTNHK
jgi:hypothetical protein